MGWYDGEARRLESAAPPDGKYLPDEPASFARSVNSSVKRNLFRLPKLWSFALFSNPCGRAGRYEVYVCAGSFW
jgi:hypothetical protein